jgi:hypothetical protein
VSKDGGGGGVGDAARGVTENPKIRSTDVQVQQFRFKTEVEGGQSYVVVKWPSDLYWMYRCLPENTYTMVGKTRLDFYEIDKGEFAMRLSYRAPGSGGDFAPGTRCTLYRDDAPFAFCVVPDPGAGYTGTLTDQTGEYGDDGYEAVLVSPNPNLAQPTSSAQLFRYKIQRDILGDLSRGVTRWPSDYHRGYGINKGNSYVIFGFMRMDFYKMDEDEGHERPSFEGHPWDGVIFKPNTVCTLYRDNNPFASIIIPDPSVWITSPMPSTP